MNGNIVDLRIGVQLHTARVLLGSDFAGDTIKPTLLSCTVASLCSCSSWTPPGRSSLLRLSSAEEGSYVLLLLVESRRADTSTLPLKTFQMSRDISAESRNDEWRETWELVQVGQLVAESFALDWSAPVNITYTPRMRSPVGSIRSTALLASLVCRTWLTTHVGHAWGVS